MTIRQLGSAFIKLLGVYYVVIWITDIANVVGTFIVGMPNMIFPEGGPQPHDLLVASVLNLAAIGIVAGICLFQADAIADRLFGEQRVNLGALTRRDLMFVGMSLVGAATALDVASPVLVAAVKILWYAEGSRRSAMWEALNPPMQPLLPTLATFALGILVVAFAARLTRVLDSRV